MIHLDQKQIGWKDPDRPDDVSRETINQLIAYFTKRLTDFHHIVTSGQGHLGTFTLTGYHG